jgi:hypothetical protein
MRLQPMRLPQSLNRAKLTPTALAMARPVQWVASPGGSEQVSSKILATTLAGSGARPVCASCRATGRRRLAWRSAFASAKPPVG